VKHHRRGGSARRVSRWFGYLGWESGLALIDAPTFVQQRDSDAAGKVFWSFERGYPIRFDIISSVYHIFSRFSILYLSLMHVTIHENGSGASSGLSSHVSWSRQYSYLGCIGQSSALSVRQSHASLELTRLVLDFLAICS